VGGQVCGGHAADGAAVGEGQVVVDDGDAVGADVHVELDTDTGVAGGGERVERVLLRAVRRVQAAVGERDGQPAGGRGEARPVGWPGSCPDS